MGLLLRADSKLNYSPRLWVEQAFRPALKLAKLIGFSRWGKSWLCGRASLKACSTRFQPSHCFIWHGNSRDLHPNQRNRGPKANSMGPEHFWCGRAEFLQLNLIAVRLLPVQAFVTETAAQFNVFGHGSFLMVNSADYLSG